MASTTTCVTVARDRLFVCAAWLYLGQVAPKHFELRVSQFMAREGQRYQTFSRRAFILAGVQGLALTALGGRLLSFCY